MFTHKPPLYAAGLWLAVAVGSPALAQSQDHYGFGTPIGQEDLVKFFAIPGDGTGLPAGSGAATARPEPGPRAVSKRHCGRRSGAR